MNAFVSIGMLFVLVAPPQQVDLQALVEQALDEVTKPITLTDVPLGDALAVIAEQTGVQLVIEAADLDLIPHGAATRVTVNIANVPLREGLWRIFEPLGMNLIVDGGVVRVVPKDVLLRLGRRVTWDELDTLAALAKMQPGLVEADLDQLKTMIQFQVAVPQTWERLATVMRNAGSGSGDEIMTTACDQLGWTWSLMGKRLVVLPIENVIRAQLQQLISLRVNNRPLIDALQAVGRKLRVAIRTEPGALAALPVSTQKNFSLNVNNASGEEVLEKIAAGTGLGYFITPDGVVFFNPSATGGVGNTSANVSPVLEKSLAADPYVGKIVVPLPDGTHMEWLLRASEVPPDILELRQRHLSEAFTVLRNSAATDVP